MRATCALPYLYPKEVYVDGNRYIDSWLASDKSFNSLLEKTLDGYETIAITVYGEKDKKLKSVNKILKPSKMPLWGALDTNRGRIIETIKQGRRDALDFLSNTNI